VVFLDWLNQHQDPLRLTVFAGGLAVMLLWEGISPRRKPTYPRLTHGLNNLILIIVGNLVVRLLLPVSAVAVAGLVANEGWGLLPYLGIEEGGLAALTGFVLLDLAIYFQHVMFHV
jgi:sterol desaturase/sphingolipid hydroxylase (fatty acid hydroxylase superfamily)